MPGLRGGRGVNIRGPHKSALWGAGIVLRPVCGSVRLHPSAKTHRTVHTRNSVYDHMQNFSRLRKRNRNPKNVRHWAFYFSDRWKLLQKPTFRSMFPETRITSTHRIRGTFTATLLIPKLYSQLWQTAATTSPPPHALLQWGLPTSSGRGAAPALESGLALTTHLWLITDTNAQAMSHSFCPNLLEHLLSEHSPHTEKSPKHTDHPGWGPSSPLQRLMCPPDWMTACSDIWLTVISQCFWKKFLLELVEWVK